MSETDQAAVAGPGGGAMLRAAREQAGVHIASLAVMLKVPVARLEALEAERFDLLPDPPFVRALVGSVCRILKIDPIPVLARFPQRAAPRLGADVRRTNGASFRTRSSPPASLAGIGNGLRHPGFWVVVILLLAAAALMLVPSARLSEWVQAVTGPRAAATATAQLPVGASPDTAADATPASAEPPVAAVAPLGPESTRDAAALVEPAPAPAGPVVPTPAAPAVAAAAPAPAVAADGLVSFTSNAQSWVRVTDSKGANVFEKVLQPGVAQSAGGNPPLSVVIGNAGATTVQVRGQAFDLSAITRNNVARFEVR